MGFRATATEYTSRCSERPRRRVVASAPLIGEEIAHRGALGVDRAFGGDQARQGSGRDEAAALGDRDLERAIRLNRLVGELGELVGQPLRLGGASGTGRRDDLIDGLDRGVAGLDPDRQRDVVDLPPGDRVVGLARQGELGLGLGEIAVAECGERRVERDRDRRRPATHRGELVGRLRDSVELRGDGRELRRARPRRNRRVDRTASRSRAVQRGQGDVRVVRRRRRDERQLGRVPELRPGRLVAGDDRRRTVPSRVEGRIEVGLQVRQDAIRLLGTRDHERVGRQPHLGPHGSGTEDGHERHERQPRR